MQTLIGKKNLTGTELVHAGVQFESRKSITLGKTSIKLIHTGQAHTPGDAVVWLPRQEIAFSGDIVYLDRLLGVLPYSNSKSWLETFKAIETLKPNMLVPGHGSPAVFAKAKTQTRDYLIHLRKSIGKVVDSGGTLIEAKKIDQSGFKDLALFDQISRRNAQAVFAEMEFE